MITSEEEEEAEGDRSGGVKEEEFGHQTEAKEREITKGEEEV